MLGSLLVALLIAIGVIYVVTARLGPTSISELRAREELEDERREAADEASEEARETQVGEEGGDPGGRRRRGSGRRGDGERGRGD